MSLNVFDEEAATKFTWMFDEDEASVWGLIVIAIEEHIYEVIGLPTIGEHYPNTHDERLAIAQFVIPTNP